MRLKFLKNIQKFEKFWKKKKKKKDKLNKFLLSWASYQKQQTENLFGMLNFISPKIYFPFQNKTFVLSPPHQFTNPNPKPKPNNGFRGLTSLTGLLGFIMVY